MSAVASYRTVFESPIPLGSLAHAVSIHCADCNSTRVTSLNMTLAARHIRFIACRDCGENQWHASGGRMSRDEVFELARKR